MRLFSTILELARSSSPVHRRHAGVTDRWVTPVGPAGLWRGLGAYLALRLQPEIHFRTVGLAARFPERISAGEFCLPNRPHLLRSTFESSDLPPVVSSCATTSNCLPPRLRSNGRPLCDFFGVSPAARPVRPRRQAARAERPSGHPVRDAQDGDTARLVQLGGGRAFAAPVKSALIKQRQMPWFHARCSRF